ncbi:MAG: hypothetical protein CMJ75_15505 [Planctomycetaceae bacterium]|nr:hypothetical protein [Planctomycetaceae bacterium]
MGGPLTTANPCGWRGILAALLLPGPAAQEAPADAMREYATVEIEQPRDAPQIVRIEMNGGGKHRTGGLFLSQKYREIQA